MILCLGRSVLHNAMVGACRSVLHGTMLGQESVSNTIYMLGKE